MNQIKFARFLMLGLFLLLLGTAVSCATTEEAVEPTTAAEAAVVEVPEEVRVVQEAALVFLRASAKVCVPPEGTPWHADTNDDFADTGTSIYLFSAEDCVLNVSYPSPATAETKFYVALRNATLDFCWQAVIDAEGKILSTEYEPVEPGLINPATVYCQEQGYTFEIRTKEDGKQCGACVFSEAEDDVCNAWDYFYGSCAPSE